MGGVYVAVFVVRCAADLLLCQTVSTDHLQFSTMHECNQAATTLISLGQASDPSLVWMARCRYLLKEGGAPAVVVEGQPQEMGGATKVGDWRPDGSDAEGTPPDG